MRSLTRKEELVADVLAEELAKDVEGDYNVSIPELAERIAERAGLPQEFLDRALAPLEEGTRG